MESVTKEKAEKEKKENQEQNSTIGILLDSNRREITVVSKMEEL